LIAHALSRLGDVVAFSGAVFVVLVVQVSQPEGEAPYKLASELDKTKVGLATTQLCCCEVARVLVATAAGGTLDLG